MKLGLLLNFGKKQVKEGIFRMINGYPMEKAPWE
jgi:hypothetical protein